MKNDDPKYETDAILSFADHNPAILFQLEFREESGFRLTYVCQRFTELTGLTTDEILHEPSKLAGLIDDSERKRIEAILKKGARGKNSFAFATEIETRHGRRWYQVQVIPFSVDKSPYLFNGIAVDITEQKQKEAGLSRTKTLLSRTLDSIDEAVFVIGPDHRQIIQTCNSAVETVFGYTQKELTGATTELLHVDTQMFQRFGEISEPVLEESGRFETEYQMRRKDGRIINTYNTVTVLDKDKGWPAGVVSTVRDITQQRQAEKEKEQLIHTLGERNKELTLLYKLFKISADPSRSIENILQTIIEAVPLAWQHPGSACARIILETATYKTENFKETRWKQTAGIAVKGQNIGTIEVCYLEDKPVRDEGPFLMEERELINALAKQLGEIIEHKQTETALQESENEFRSLVEDINDVIFRINESGIFTYVSPVVKNLGYDAGELIGKHFSEVIHAEDLKQVSKRFEKAMHGETRPFEYRVVTKAGELVWVRTSTKPIFKDDLFTGVQGVSTNITEEKNLNEQLQQAQKMEAVGRLAGGVAHDFNNLLSIILGYGDMVLEEMGGDQPHYDSIRQIHDAGKRAKNLTRQLLAFGRKQVLEMRRVDINEILSGLSKLMRRVISEDINLQLHLTSEPLWVMADTTQIEQVLMNLAVNARDAMPDGGALTIETADVELDDTYASQKPGVTPGRYAMLAVSDNGMGMDVETRKLIFEPFFTTKGKEKGTGLGLATCYGIIKQHKGNIWLYTEPGEGTTFKIYLPLQPEESEKTDRRIEQKKAPITGDETILVVEDDASVRRLSCSILQKRGYKVLEAEDVHNAVELSKNHDEPIHLLLVDVIMPDMKGPEVFEKVAAHHPEIKVIYMSGYTDDVIAHHGILEKGLQFIQKPFTVQGLTFKVREVLEQ
jgi:PAS domain S-box-containing protein